MTVSLTTLPKAFLLAASLGCAPPAEPPAVTIQFQNNPYQLITSVGVDQLQQLKSDTKVSQGSTETFKTVGTAVGQISADMRMSFKTLSNPATGQGCIWVNGATILVTYDPKILIAAHFKPGSCRYRTTYEHELRHVNTDIVTINQFTPVIRDAIAIRARQLGTIGPVDTEGMKAAQAQLNTELQATLQAAMDKMMQVRGQRQQIIDTRQEYLRLSKACPGEPALPPH